MRAERKLRSGGIRCGTRLHARRQTGLGLIGWLLMIPASIVVLLILAVGFYEGRKAYWDSKVREMCEKDGGVQILEKLRISKSDIDLLETADGKISVATKELANPRAPAYAVNRVTGIKNGNPSVWRSEWEIVRRLDQAVVARWVAYSRSGGYFPTGLAHDSRLTCPDLKKITSDMQQLFFLEGNSK